MRPKKILTEKKRKKERIVITKIVKRIKNKDLLAENSDYNLIGVGQMFFRKK